MCDHDHLLVVDRRIQAERAWSRLLVLFGKALA